MKLLLLTLLIVGYAVAKMETDEIGFDFHYNCNIGLEIPLDGYVTAIKSLFNVPEIAQYLNPAELSKKIDDVVNAVKGAFDQLKRLPTLDKLLEKTGELVVDEAEKQFNNLKTVFSTVTVDQFANLLKMYNMTVLVDQVNGVGNKLTSSATNSSNIIEGAADGLKNKIPSAGDLVGKLAESITVPSIPFPF